MKLKMFLGIFSILIFSSCSMFQGHQAERGLASKISDDKDSININMKGHDININRNHIIKLLTKHKSRGKALSSVHDIKISRSFRNRFLEYGRTYNPAATLLNNAKNAGRFYHYRLAFSTPDLDHKILCTLRIRVEFRNNRLNLGFRVGILGSSMVVAKDCQSQNVYFKDDYIFATFKALGIGAEKDPRESF